MKQNIKKTAIELTCVSALMFGFGYLLVPMYDLICELTGLNGKTGRISAATVNADEIDNSRVITVEFDTNVNSDLPWSFKAIKREVRVRPGEIGEASFSVVNLADWPITGQAIPSVAPSRGSLYFNKTECFCFSQQLLGPQEEKQMAVRFVVDPALPDSIQTLVLSYTFFEAPKASTDVSQSASKVTKKSGTGGKEI